MQHENRRETRKSRRLFLYNSEICYTFEKKIQKISKYLILATHNLFAIKKKEKSAVTAKNLNQ